MRNIIKPAFTLFIICAVIAFALAFVNLVTKDIISQRELEAAEKARMEVFSQADNFELVEYTSTVNRDKAKKGKIIEVYRSIKDKETAGYVFTVASKGYGGDIKVIAGIDMNRKITGVKIGDNKETPGLGSKASDEAFLSKFRNVIPGGAFKVVKASSTRPEEIEALSSATITTKAVVDAVQAAVDAANELINKEGNGN